METFGQSFLFATDERVIGLPDFVLHTGYPAALFAIVTAETEDPTRFLSGRVSKKYKHDNQSFNVAFIPFSDYEVDIESLMDKAFVWYTEYTDWEEAELMLETGHINIDGREIMVSRNMEGDMEYTALIEGQRIIFLPDENGNLKGRHTLFPKDFLDRVAEKIESYFL
ncbi:hypothetical protein [Chitinophaga sp. MM2321]|uniref:hypothetical protein n=1 Tax=Chitinophaga sp. MM2321 TaxID=3137178 RepID=UPI0032D5B029